MPVVKEIIGRTEDVVVGKDGREMVRFHSIFEGLGTIKQAQIIQESYDDMVIRVVTDNKLSMHDKTLMRNRIKSQLGEMNILVEEVETIPLTANGKFKAVMSKVERKKQNGLAV